MQVAVYSGSFDPLHIGHLAILEHLVAVYDAVYLIVSPQNPLKSSDKAVNADSRLDAARKAVARHPELNGKVYVDDIEYSMPTPNYTINTLDALKLREPENEFDIVMGADNLGCFRKWRDYQRILLEYGVAVYPRTGTDLEEVVHELKEEDGRYVITLIDQPKVDVSSTEIREKLASGEDVSALLM